MDEIGRALAADEIEALYLAGPSGKCTDCGCAEGVCAAGGAWCEDASCSSGGVRWPADSFVSWLHCGGADQQRGCDQGFCDDGSWCEELSRVRRVGSAGRRRV